MITNTAILAKCLEQLNQCLNNTGTIFWYLFLIPDLTKNGQFGIDSGFDIK